MQGWHSLPPVNTPIVKREEMAPGLARKLLVTAAIDGLVLQPLGQRGQRPSPAAKITYKDNNIGSVSKDGGESGEGTKSFEAFGVVGKPEEALSVPRLNLRQTCHF